MAFSLVSPPAIDAGILDRLDEGATARSDREAALTIAAKPAASTPVNKYWRIDFARVDLRLNTARPLVTPRYQLPAELSGTGTVFCSLAEAAQRHPELVRRHLGSVVPANESRFTAIAAALEQGGFYLYVPAGVKLSVPITIDVAVPQGSLWCPRSLIVLEENAAATVHERIAGSGAPSDREALVCGTVEAIVGQNAHLHAVTQQLLDGGAQCFMTRRAALAQNAEAHWAVADFGGALVQTQLDTRLDGNDAASDTAAIFFPHADQHIDIKTEVVHVVPNTTSRTMVKAAAKDNGQGRFAGNIRILPGAHGSSATLRDDTLLLSAGAHIDSVPALEIAANDVQAFHGATVGAIDDEVRFYLMSRGISGPEADRMITLAFFEPAIERIDDSGQREQIANLLAERVGSANDR